MAASILSRYFLGEFMRSFIFIAAFCAALNSYPAGAQKDSGQEAVRIETDQAAKAFVFIIDDEPVAMLDKAGLHVPGEINYGQSLTDTGPDWTKDKIASRGKEASDE